MNYLTTTEAGEKWGVSSGLVLKLAKNNRIPGTVQIGTRWMIPADAEKPVDGRTKAGKVKTEQTPDTFRYPIFEHRDISSFRPPLSEEELRMKQVTEACHACRFEEADRLMSDLPERSMDRYHRLHYLYVGCMIDISLCNTKRFYDRYGRLRTELKENFPHKIEMEEYLHQLDATLGENRYYTNQFRIVPGYQYHESFLPRLACLSAVPFSYANAYPTVSDMKSHECNCLFLEHSQAYVDLQSLHIYLGSAYALMNRSEEMTCHFKKALVLAERYSLYYVPALQYFYMRKLFEPALSGFSEDFKKRLESISDDIHQRYLRFTDTISVNSIYKLLTHDEYIFLYYALQGYSHKEVAGQLHISVGSVGKTYSEIYAALGVANKNEMIELYRKSVDESVLG